MAKQFDTVVTEGDVCSFCGAPAKTRSRYTGNYSCELSANKCPAVRAKNSKGLSKAHKDGRLGTIQFKNLRAWNKGKNILTDRRVGRKHKLDELFCEHSKAPRYFVKELIIKNQLKPYKCEKCNIIDEWNGYPISLQLDHINGINNDNRIENLRFLCPNCHSQTPSFCGRGKNFGKKYWMIKF